MAAVKAAVQITVNRAELSRKLTFVGFAAEVKSTIPILAMVKLSAKPGSLRMAATDLDVSAQASMLIDSEAEVEICVDSKRLAAFVKSLPDAEVALKFEEKMLRVTGARSKMNFAGIGAENFPSIEMAEGGSIALPAVMLAALLKASSWATSKDESRFSLSAVKVDVKPDKVRCVSADGVSMAIADAPVIAEREASCLLPSRSVPAILGLLSEAKNEVFVTLTEKAVWFETGVYSISTRLMTGQFPQCELVENAKYEHVCTADVGELAAALNRLAIIAPASANKGKYLALKTNDDQLELLAPASEAGDGLERVQVEMTGQMDTYADGVRLLAALAHSEVDKIAISQAPAGQIRFAASWPVGESGKISYRAFVMNAKP